MVIAENKVRVIKLADKAAIRGEGDTWGRPIRTVRTSKFTFVILFDESLFTKELLPITLRGCLRGQNLWKLYEPETSQYPGYTSFLVQVENHLLGEEVEAAMLHVVEAMTEAAYRQELRRRFRKTPASKLPFLYMQPKQGVRPVSRRAAQALRLAGYETLEGLAWCSSDELCQIPGMSARDVFDIELNLSSMGFSLMTSPVPPWDASTRTTRVSS